MTRFILSAGAAALLVFSTLISGQPTTAPTVTTRQLIVEPNPASYSSILVLPFTPVAGASEWIGKGIQEDLATELVRQSRLSVLTSPDVGPAADAAEAAKIGRDRNVSLVAFGTYQIVDTQVRINGQVVDVVAGRAIAALKATGARRDLFHMEDVLAAQTVAALPPGSVKVGFGAYASNATGAQSGNNSTEPYNPQGYYVMPGPDFTPTYDYGTYSQTPAPASVAYPAPYDYAYPPYDYGYDYPFLGGGFVFIGGFGHDHGHGDHHGGGTFGGGPRSTGGFGGGFHGGGGGSHGGGGGGHR
jgi:TolB-like protein